MNNEDFTKKVHVRCRNGKWSYRFEKAPVGGKRKSAERGGFATEEEAFLAGVQAYTIYENGGAEPRDARLSFADYLDLWFERTRLSVRNNTVELREKMLRLHIKPALGEHRLSSLTPEAIEDFVRAKRLEGYAFETVSRMLCCISSALDYAIYPMRFIKENAARHIKVPGKEFAPLSHRIPRRRLENEELARIFELHPFGTTYHMPFILGAYFGCRLGEALAASWEGCNFEQMTLMFSKQIQRLTMKGKHTFHYYCDLKTESSLRTLAFDKEMILPLFKRWRKEQAQNELFYGEDYSYNYLVPAKDYQNRLIWKVVSLEKAYPAPGRRLDLICTQPNGKFIQPTSLSYQCKRIRNLGIHGFDFHCLRHTNLTMLGESHVSPNAIMARAGHTDFDTTARFYIENRLSMQDVPVEVFRKNFKEIL